MLHLSRRLFLFALACASTFSAPFALAQPSIAVVEFEYEPNARRLPDSVAALMSESLVNSGLFSVFERDRLAAIMREQGLQGSGEVDPATAVELGRLAGVSYLLTGNIVDASRETKTFRGYGITSQSTVYRLSASIRIIDVSNGQIVFAQSDTASHEHRSSNSTTDDDTVYLELARNLTRKFVNAMSENQRFKPKEEAPKHVMFRIDSNPPGADLEVDGVYYGNTGGEFKVPPGLHDIKVTMPGYETWEKRVMVRDGMTFTANLQPTEVKK